MSKVTSQKGATNQDQTVKVTVYLTTELTDKIDKKATEMFGERKSARTMYIEQAMRLQLHMHVKGVAEK
jgi:hypothetical protein